MGYRISYTEILFLNLSTHAQEDYSHLSVVMGFKIWLTDGKG